MYGDTGVLERNFGAMAAWMDFLRPTTPTGCGRGSSGNNYGDWLAPKGDLTPRELLATAYWAYDADPDGGDRRGHRPAREGRGVRAAGARGQRGFHEGVRGRRRPVWAGTQTAYVLALHMGLVPEDLRADAAAHLVEAIAKEDWHLTTGFVGVGYLLPVLSSNGYSDVAYRLLEQRSFPSWLYTIDRGATTIWERWDGWTEEQGFPVARMNSFNHYSLGSVGEWLYRFVLGIELAPGAAGFDRVVLGPTRAGRWPMPGVVPVRPRARSRRPGRVKAAGSRLTSESRPMSGPACASPRRSRSRSWTAAAPVRRRWPGTRVPSASWRRCSRWDPGTIPFRARSWCPPRPRGRGGPLRLGSPGGRRSRAFTSMRSERTTDLARAVALTGSPVPAGRLQGYDSDNVGRRPQGVGQSRCGHPGSRSRPPAVQRPRR